jgi:hypothetical protein
MMLSYHFALWNNRSEKEDLGFLAMANDDEALAFGCDIIRLIQAENAPAYAGSVVEITQEDRAVGSIPFNFETSRRQKIYA